MRFLISFIFWIALVVSAQSQGIMFPGPGGGPFTPPAPYCGPGDTTGACTGGVASPTAFFSCGRAVDAAYANGTNPLCVLTAATGGAAVCTLRVQTNGYADLSSYCTGGTQTPAQACAAASGGGCRATMVDQVGTACSGTCDLVNSNGGTTKPTVTFSAQNGLPCLSFGGADNLTSANTLGSTLTAGNYTFTMMTKVGGASNGRMWVSGALQAGILDNGAGTVRMFAGSSLNNATNVDGSFQAYVGVGGASGTMTINGNTASGSAGTSSINSNLSIGCDSSGANCMSMTACEFGLWSSGFTATPISNMVGNIRSSTSGWNF